MAKRNTFEELLESDFRWPQKGDIPFASSATRDQNAFIETEPLSKLVAMMHGYKTGADVMVEHTISNSFERDFLVYPIIFNYRHFIELNLKYLLSTYGPAVDVMPNWKDHDLAPLWESLVVIIERFGTTDSDDADEVVAEIISEFCKIDPQSFSLRYPTDKKGKPIPVSVEELDLTQLKDVMNGVAGFFTGCDGYFDSLISARP